MESAPAQVNRSLEGGLACLLELVSGDGPRGVRELARALDMEPTRVSRLLGTLAWLGLAARTSDRKYVPGSGIHVLSAMSLQGSHLLPKALPHLRVLGEQTGLIVALGALWRDRVCYLYHGPAGCSAESAIGARGPFPAARSSIGRVLLAARPPDAVRELYERHPEGLPPGLSVSEFLEELAAVRERGFSRGGVAGESLAVAVGDPPAAGLALAGAPEAACEETLRKRLSETASAITAALG